MNKKLIFVFALITLSMIGIIAFQVDWMRKTYILEQRKIKTAAENALISALLRVHKRHNDETLRFLLPQLRPFADSLSIRFTGNANVFMTTESQTTSNSDSLMITFQNKLNTAGHHQGMPRFRVSYDIGRVNILFAETDGRSDAPSQQEIKKTIDRLIPPVTSTCDPTYSTRDSLLLFRYFKEDLVRQNLADLAKVADLSFLCGNRPVITSLTLGTDFHEYLPEGLTAYTGTRRWVAAYFQNRDNHILSAMFGNIVLSGLLILTAIASFIYLLTLIMTQKRLAGMKDDFINNMTHELKTPIATISAAIESMQNFSVLQDAEKTARYLETSRTELNRLNDLVTQVLNMAAYEKKEIRLTEKAIVAKALIEDIVHTERLKTSKSVSFAVALAPGLQIQADPIHFRNALANLVDNAIKYTPEPVEVTVNGYTDEHTTYFEVIDNGPGIPPSELTRIFDKFYRISTGAVHTVKGTGLGLSYVKYIVELHGGAVNAKSEINRGSTFTISLPVKK